MHPDDYCVFTNCVIEKAEIGIMTSDSFGTVLIKYCDIIRNNNGLEQYNSMNYIGANFIRKNSGVGISSFHESNDYIYSNSLND